MSRPLRIAVFVGSFPVTSETFIVRQITGLLELAQEPDIYADTRAEGPLHPEVSSYRLLERTTYLDVPPETVPWEMPVWPITGRTWPPGSGTSVSNSVRVARALPKLYRCLMTVPRLTRQALRRTEYGYQAASLSALYRLATLVAAGKKYDVLHAHFGPIGNSYRFAGELWNAPLVVSFHGYDFSTLPRKEGAGVYARLFETADLFTVNSQYTRRQVEKLGCRPEKIRPLPVGLDLAEFPFKARTRGAGEPTRILTIGRLVEIKGHEQVIRAVRKLRECHPAIRYDIVGDGPLRSRLGALVGQLGLPDVVTFHGAKAGPDVKRLMDEAHVFVLASVSVEGDQEGQGLVLQEAQAVGLPVIATNHGALPEGIVVGESGFLVPERDDEALVDRLSHLIEHPEIWPLMGRKGRAFVERHYDVRKLNVELVKIYSEAVESYRARHHAGCSSQV